MGTSTRTDVVAGKTTSPAHSTVPQLPSVTSEVESFTHTLPMVRCRASVRPENSAARCSF